MKTPILALLIALLLPASVFAYEYVSNNPVNAVDPLGLYLTYRGGGTPAFWNNYRKSYSDMMNSGKGRQMLKYLENSPTEMNVGPSILLPPNNTSLTGSARPGLTTCNNGVTTVVLDTNSGLGDRLLIPHEFYHASERLAGIDSGSISQADPFGWGTTGSYPSWDRTGKESRATRGANMMSSEFGGGIIKTYDNRLVPFPTGGGY